MIVALLLSLTLHAEPSPEPSLSERLDRLERVVAPADPAVSVTLLGPVASKAYRATAEGPRVGLATEFFTLRQGTPPTDADPAATHTDVLNVRPTFGYRLHPRVLFNAQLSFDTGGAEKSDTVTLRRGAAITRFAYLDWFFSRRQLGGVRVGHQLVPVGLSNTTSDAMTFFGVRRPPLEREILPPDWHENGALAWFDARQVTLEAGVFTGLNARGFRGPSFVGGGRSSGQDAPSSNLMMVVRANVREEHWLVGGSMMLGDSAQGNAAVPSGRVWLGELHARRQTPSYQIGVQVVDARVADAGVISALNQTVVGARATGASAEAAVRVGPGDESRLWIFVRQAAYDLNARVGAGFTADPAVNRVGTTLGLSYLPLPNLVLKAEVARDGDAADRRMTEVALGAGLVY